ncbi:hypothetical protein Bca4012_005198 [Brassica carinata]
MEKWTAFKMGQCNSDQAVEFRQGKREEKCRVQMKNMRASMLTVKVDITPLESETSFQVDDTSLRENSFGANSPPFGLPTRLTLL